MTQSSEQPSVREQIKAAVEKRRVAIEQNVVRSNGKIKIDSSLIMDCLDCNAMGDGILYAVLHNDKYVYNKSAAEWLRWAGNFWEMDLMELHKGSVDQVCETYLSQLDDLGEKVLWAIKKKDSKLEKKYRAKISSIYTRVKKLREKTGRESALLFSHTNMTKSLAISGHLMDANPWLLACANGVIDLRLGELRAGDPSDYITKNSPVEWHGLHAPAPAWEQFLSEIFMADQQMIAYVQRLFGYACAGLTVEHIVPILYGPAGRNGKGTLVKILQQVMGSYSAPIQAEMLLDQGRARSSSGPSPDILALRGLRMAFASETDENRRFSTARVKWLSGGDMLVARGLQEKRENRFDPTHTLFLLTNNLPDAPEEDSAFWERTHIVPFRMSFVRRDPQGKYERPADIYLEDKLKQELPGVLAWLVRGCLQWQSIGMDPPDDVIEASKEARQNEDYVTDFITRCCILDEAETTSSASLWRVFRAWWMVDVHPNGPPFRRKKFGQMMKRKFESGKTGKNGTIEYYGIGLIPDEHLDFAVE